MELTEKIDSLNQQIRDLYGIDTVNGLAMWRIVWSETQFEKRLTEYTDSGIKLLFPEIRELPKYKQWIKEKYVLERLVVVPVINLNELGGVKVSYEPIYVYMDKGMNYAPPCIEVTQFVIDTIYAAEGKSSLAKYKDNGETPDKQEERLQRIERELFGNETDTGDALAHGEGVGFTTSKILTEDKVH